MTPTPTSICPQCGTLPGFPHSWSCPTLNAHSDLGSKTLTVGHYHVAISDAERRMMEQSSFQFHELTGKKMRIPPKLFQDLKDQGVSMIHMEADKGLEQ